MTRSSAAAGAADTSPDATSRDAAPGHWLLHDAAAVEGARFGGRARASRPRAVPRVLGAGPPDELAVAAAGFDRHLRRRRHVRGRWLRGAARGRERPARRR